MTELAAAIRIDPEFHALIPPLSDEERTQLEYSLLSEGCRDALVTWNNTLIDGHNRLEICQRRDLPYAVIEREFESREDVIAWICANQMARRNLTPMARGELALRMKAAIAAKAKAQQVRKPDSVVLQNFGEQTAIRTDKQVAAIAEVSHETIRKIETIQQDAPEEVKASARAGDISIHRAYELTRRLLNLPDGQREDAARLCADSTEKADALVRLCKSEGSPETNGTYSEIMATGGFAYGDDMERWCDFPACTSREIDAALRSVAKHHAREEMEARREHRVNAVVALSAALGTYPVIYADPPWRYEHVKTESRAIENHYPTLSLEEICALRVQDIAHEKSVLFLWATSPKLDEAMQVIRAWDFTYRTFMVWIKDRIGMGYYARQQHEALLIATRGGLPVPEPSDRAPSVVFADRLEHSAKPPVFYDIIEAMYPEYANKIELFSRDRREGWTGWGNQYDDGA